MQLIQARRTVALGGRRDFLSASRSASDGAARNAVEEVAMSGPRFTFAAVEARNATVSSCAGPWVVDVRVGQDGEAWNALDDLDTFERASLQS